MTTPDRTGEILAGLRLEQATAHPTVVDACTVGGGRAAGRLGRQHRPAGSWPGCRRRESLFTDAVTRHGRAPFVRRRSVDGGGADLLTALPYERPSPGPAADRAGRPWSILPFLPLALAYRLRSRRFRPRSANTCCSAGASTANWGHAADSQRSRRRHRPRPADQGPGVPLASGRCHAAYALPDVSSTRARSSKGSRGTVGHVGSRVLPFVWVSLWLGIVFLLPAACCWRRLLGAPIPDLDIRIALIGVALGLTSWGIFALRFGFRRTRPGSIRHLPVRAVCLRAVSSPWCGGAGPPGRDGRWYKARCAGGRVRSSSCTERHVCLSQAAVRRVNTA